MQKMMGLLFLCFLMVSNSMAIEGDLTIGGGFGLGLPVGDLADAVDGGFGFHIFGQYEFTDTFAIKPVLDYRFMSGEETLLLENYYRLDSDLSILNLSFDGVANFEIYDDMVISGIVGLGLYSWNVDVNSSYFAYNLSESGTSLGLDIGGSYTYSLNDDMSLRATLKQHFVDFDDWLGGCTFTDISASFVYLIPGI